jgi:hypothetical protein
MGMSAAKWVRLVEAEGWSDKRIYRANKRYERRHAHRAATRIVLNRGQFVLEVYWTMQADWWRWEIRRFDQPCQTLGQRYEGMVVGRGRALRLARKALKFARGNESLRRARARGRITFRYILRNRA